VPDISPPRTECSDTAKKVRVGIPFAKGADPRRNVNGRKPKSFDEFRSIAQAIAQKTIKDQKTGEELTLADALLRKCAASDEPALIKLFIEYAFGKVPEKIEGTGFTAPVIVIKHAHELTEEARQPAFEPSGS